MKEGQLARGGFQEHNDRIPRAQKIIRKFCARKRFKMISVGVAFGVHSFEIGSFIRGPLKGPPTPTRNRFEFRTLRRLASCHDWSVRRVRPLKGPHPNKESLGVSNTATGILS